MVLKKLLAVVGLLILTFSTITVAQDTSKNDLNLVIPRKLGFNPKLFIPGGIQYEINFSPQLILNKENDSSTIWLRTEMSLTVFRYLDFKPRIDELDLIEPLIIQYQNKQKLSIVKYLIGLAQSGAAGYLAYRHIKKYGFGY